MEYSSWAVLTAHCWDGDIQVAFRRHGPQRQWTKYLTGLRQSLDTYLTGAQAAQWAAARDRKEAVGAAFKADEQVHAGSGICCKHGRCICRPVRA